MRLRLGLLALCAVLLSACGGWYLRGTQVSQIAVRKVFVRADSSSYLLTWFQTHLAYSGVTLARSPGEAEAVVDLRGERYDRRVLSVDDQTGKVREMELGLEVEFSVRSPTGELIAAPERVQWTQDFVFDEASLLGTEEVETTIRYELAKDAARALMFRLEAVDFANRGRDAG